jgi:deoxyadenosine/deoxycytidine kinase
VNDEARPPDRLLGTRFDAAVAETRVGRRSLRETLLTRRSSTEARPYLVEVAGVAGAGKSTLTHLLCQGEADCSRADFIHARTPEHLAYVAHSLPRLLPILIGNLRPRSRLSWAEFKLLVYVSEWHRFLNRKSEYDHGCTLLDQGPIYALVRLKAESKSASVPAFERWWNQKLELWAHQLSTIIWLDTADQVIWDRINERGQRHRTKGAPLDVGRRFLAKYRRLFEEVLDRVSMVGGPEILRFDTSEMGSEQIAEHLGPILAAHSSRWRERDGPVGEST